jgi:hypothetical protein
MEKVCFSETSVSAYESTRRGVTAQKNIDKNFEVFSAL